MRQLFSSFFLFLIIAVTPIFANQILEDIEAKKWAASTLDTLSIDEKIGQLLICGVFPQSADAQKEGILQHPIVYVEEAIEKYHVGSLLFKYSWTPESLRQRLSYFQSLSTIPLLTMQDLEWGLNMRHPGEAKLPYNITLGAIQDDKLIYKCAKKIAHQTKALGLDLNLAPVVDVNTNPQNPIIGSRSFGQDPLNVAIKASIFISSMQKNGIATCAKHFPGHGDTSQDSHVELCKVDKSLDEIQKTSLIPFKKAIESGVKCIMTAHITVPSVDALPATLSQKWIQGILRSEMNFDGIVITDDFAMKAIDNHYSIEKASVLAFKAGCDLIMSSTEIPKTFSALKKAYNEGVITEEEINDKVRKILAFKYLCKQQKAKGRTESISIDSLNAKLYENAITTINSPSFLNHQSCIYVQIGNQTSGMLHDELKKVIPKLASAYLGPISSQGERAYTLRKLKSYDSHVICLCGLNRNASQNYGISPDTEIFIDELEKSFPHAIFVVFATPYTLSFFHPDTSVVLAYEDQKEAHVAVAKVLLRIKKAKGLLPVVPMRKRN